jgi:antitoxin component YwqK of YwqJK toxin-antitoxin module
MAELRKSVLLLAGIISIAVAILTLRRPRPVIEPLPEVSLGALVSHNGRLHQSNDAVPFVGFVTERYDGGPLKARSAISNGVLNGLSEGWYTNGALEVREHFQNGMSAGRREKWHPNGQKLSEVMVVNGKLNGVFRRWHDNGQLAEEIQMKAGHADGIAKAWYPSGFAKAEARLENGKLIEQKTWDDGQKREPLK